MKIFKVLFFTEIDKKNNLENGLISLANVLARSVIYHMKEKKNFLKNYSTSMHDRINNYSLKIFYRSYIKGFYTKC